MKCSEVMKSDVERVRPSEAVSSAAQKMRARNIGFLPVCDERDKILGTITDRDIVLRVVADSRQTTTPVSDAMTTEAITCRVNDDIHVAEQLMAKHQKSRIMCVDEAGVLAGVISLSDIAQHERSSSRTASVLTDVTDRETHA